jgi:ubiquinone biosynthesis protein
VGLSLQPKRLGRYKDIARLLFKYGRKDLVSRAGLDDALEAEALSADEKDDPEQLAADLERLGPAFVKLGQLLSTRADLLPAPYLDALSRLQDSLEPFSFAEVEQIVQDDLGFRLSKGFASFESVPIAAASLGQVHRAQLRDGREVAVKVQRPNIREAMAEDLATIEDIAGFLDNHTSAGPQFDFTQMVHEFRRAVTLELDYRREASNLTRVAENLGAFSRIVVPRPIDDYTSSRVLTMELVKGQKVTAITPLTRQEIDGPGLATELFRAYLHQIIVNGFFHADPHPGNVFLTDDGRIALLDLGMVSRLTPSRQEQLLKLLLAISEADGDRATDLALEMGECIGEVDRTTLKRDIQELLGAYLDAPLAQVQVGRAMMELTRISGQHGVRLPSELTLLGKTLLNLDQVGRALDPNFDVNAALRSEGPDLMQQRMRQTVRASSFYATALETKEFMEQLPGRVNKLLDAATNNQLKLNVDLIDEGAIMGGLQKVANRITLGLLLASLIIGAAMLMQVPTNFRILGYPGVAMFFFVIAACGAIWLAITIIRSDQPTRRPR